MGALIRVDFNQEGNINKLRESINDGYKERVAIKPANEEFDFSVRGSHTAEPIKDIEVIEEISRKLVAKREYRENMLFICGINLGLRVSDLLSLRFSHFIDNEYRFRDEFSLLEKKTQNTRKKKSERVLYINRAVKEAISLYLENNQNTSLSDYLFRSKYNIKEGINIPLDKRNVNRILEGIAKEFSLGEHFSSHSLRKTFGYQHMAMAGNSPRTLFLLQKMFGHSSSEITLSYIGITKEEIKEACMGMNLGYEDRERENIYIRDREKEIDSIREDIDNESFSFG